MATDTKQRVDGYDRQDVGCDMGIDHYKWALKLLIQLRRRGRVEYPVNYAILDQDGGHVLGRFINEPEYGPEYETKHEYLAESSDVDREAGMIDGNTGAVFVDARGTVAFVRDPQGENPEIL